MDISAYIDIPIVVLTYFIVEVVKRKLLKNDKQRALLPVVAACTGAAISMLIFAFMPSISTNVNLLNAFASGAISGSAATGSNQFYKQLTRFFTVTPEETSCQCNGDCCDNE
jgi:hypothetical protein